MIISFQDNVKYEHVGEDTRKQEWQKIINIKEKISETTTNSMLKTKIKIKNPRNTSHEWNDQRILKSYKDHEFEERNLKKKYFVHHLGGDC